ncbi:MAG: molybdopterin-dependent oxidoreductase, partial [Lachnospiraceae bacterium]|nr:molybdopterin-dependent oxidoreductase [Lachnospiraceae bacterium]
MSLLKRIADAKISRRDFLVGSATATASMVLIGCGSKETTLTETDPTKGGAETPTNEVGTKATMTISDTDQKIMNGEGKWISAACWHNCGGRCLNKAYVVDGIVLRQKTDDREGDGFDNPQQRGCPRGRSQRQQILGADRLKYPMKRKNWSPENPNGHLRGRDEWERISWDEALNYIASELKRIKAQYGNRSIYCPGGDELYRTMIHFGGYASSWCSSSVGAWQYAADCGLSFIGADGNDKYNHEDSDVFFMLGCNPAWSSMGPSGIYWKRFRDMGKLFIAVDPFYNDSYSMMGAEWVPVHPNSDQALLFGIAYEMMKLDETKGDIVDWEFLNTYTIGFDADHMPEGEDPKDNFKDYVLGTYDGVPKDAAWASIRCGVAENKIRELAEVLGKKTKLSFLFSWANSRATNAENLPQLYMTVAAMGGHIGRKGHAFSACNNQWSGTGWNMFDPVLVVGDRGLPPLANPVDDCMCDATVWEDILNGKYVHNCSDYTLSYTSNPLVRTGSVREIDIRMIYFGGLNGWSVGQETSNLQTKLNMSKGIEAVRKMDFVACNA